MAFLIIPTDIKVSSWVKHFSRLDPGIDIRIWPEVGDADDIEFAFSIIAMPEFLEDQLGFQCHMAFSIPGGW